MKRIIISLSVLLIFSLSLFSQTGDEKTVYRPIQFFVGLQPAVDIELFDEFRNSFDVNIIPIQLEYAINNKWSLRLSPHAFVQFKPEFPSELSKVGTGLTVPYHFSKKNSEEGHRGFYAGPHGGFTMHRLDNFISTTIAGEIGYKFLFNSILSFNIGVQAGKTIQMDPNGSYSLISNHSAAVMAFGIWF